MKDIYKRNNNINLLKNETYMNKVNNISDLEKEKKKNIEKIKLLEKETELLMEKLEEIKNRRNSIQYQHEKELGIIEKNKKLKLKKFIEDLNNKEKNELLEEKFKTLQENSKKLQLKMQEDLKEAIERKKCEIDRYEKEKDDNIKKFINDMKKKEKENIQKRNQNAKEQILKLKKLINNKPSNNKHIYQEKEDNYNKNEENLIKKENIKRKEYMKHIELNEFNEFSKHFDEIKSKKVSESKLKTKKERENWAQRYKLIPEYVNPLSQIIVEEEKKIKNKEEEENLEKQKYKNLQKNYKVPKPIKNVKEKSLDNNNKDKKMKKILLKSNSYSDILRKKLMSKFYSAKNKKEKQEEENKKIENKKIINFKLPLICFKEREKKINKSFEKEKNNKKQELITEYLRQRRFINEKNREKKRNIGELSNLDYNQTNNIKKLIKENGMDENTLKIAKSKLENLEEKKKQKALLLKINGGIANKPELGEEIYDLMIDSIQARLSIIEEIENLGDKNNTFNINDEQNEKNDIE